MASSLLRIIIRAILPVINKAHTVVLGIKPLERNSVICIEVKRHRGRPVKLEDGCRIGLGDPVIKLHFNDAWITNALQSTSASKGKGFPRGVFYNFRDGLHLLAAEVADGKYGNIVAVYGWTAFYAYAKRLGFQVIDLPNTLRIKLARLHISALMQSHQAPRSGKRISSRKPVKVKAVWLSLAELLRIYGSV
ncbi:MAG: hypothetical protein JSW22_02365 [Chloroflexota bacterium]|nr:MAG: hypothetical protein JSW22_02365 [Chloroflexota bacterium]